MNPDFAGRLGRLRGRVALVTGSSRGIGRAIAQAFGRLDVLVNNAGSGDRTPFREMDEARWRAMMDVHLTGPVFAAQAAAEAMTEDGGVIINIASMRGIDPGTGAVHYSVSKAAVIMLTRCLARDLAPAVRVNAIAPGYTETAFHAERTIADRQAIASRIPLGRFAQPEEVAKAAVFLASDEAAYITGDTLIVSGGVVTR